MNDATDTTTSTTSPTEPASSAPIDVPDGPSVQSVLPLPFDDEADEPIAFSITARGRRAVAPQELPDLSVVTGQFDPDDRSDTRPARARALRRAGHAPDEIAAQLGVDELLVQAWVDGVRVKVRTGGARRRATRLRVVEDDSGKERELADLRARAQQEAASRMEDPSFALGLGLVAALAEEDRHAVTMVATDEALVARVASWLGEFGGLDSSRVRVVVRMGPSVAGDLARHRWARALGIEPEQVAASRWRDAPEGDAEQVMVRIADPRVAAVVGGWRDALVSDGRSPSLDLAF